MIEQALALKNPVWDQGQLDGKKNRARAKKIFDVILIEGVKHG